METMIFPNLPVKDLDAAKAFYQALGYSINPNFTDENASAVVISDTIVVMLLREEFFRTFTTRAIADTSTTVEILNGLGVASRDEVDRLAEAAAAAGGRATREPQDQGFMYSRTFADLDGHEWSVLWMDPSAAQ
ncbi:VOC family protein [Phytomonospora sp. NPDC050363]|uniref:VOC family protein n=1 Tax=Phytomonospora sp. NPDC050363 TaxID=3155642 RepID=UPI0033DA9FD1